MNDEVVNFPSEGQSIQDMNQDLIQYENKIISGSSLQGLFLHDTILTEMNHFSFMSRVGGHDYITKQVWRKEAKDLL